MNPGASLKTVYDMECISILDFGKKLFFVGSGDDAGIADDLFRSKGVVKLYGIVLKYLDRLT